MNFLVWYNPLTWLGDIADTLFGAIVAGLNILLYFLSTFVYGLIVDLYSLFNILSKSRILDADIIETLANRIGLVLGVVMLFMVIISAIQMILDPDKIEKDAGNIIKKVLLVIVMLGASNFAFRALYGVQNILLESNVISKLLLPYNVDTENFGGVLSSELFGAFYYVNNDLYTIDEAGNIIADGDVIECYETTVDLKEGIRDNKEFGAGYQCLNATSEDLNIIKFNGLLLLIFGIVAAYFLLSYCISVGVRTIQLAFLEIISPMAIISYLSPKKDTMFEKWWKLYFSTYIDVFIRVILINFIVFLIATIFENDGGWAFWKSVEQNGGPSGDFFIEVMMIMALFTFAQKAPTLIKNLFPGSDSGIGFGFNSGAAGILGMGAALGINTAGKLASTVGRTGKALGWQKGVGFKENLNNLKNGLKNNKGAAFKTLATSMGAMTLGATTSLFRGGKAGFSSKNPMGAIKGAATEQSKANLTREQRINAGGTLRNKFNNIMNQNLGLQDSYSLLESEVSSYNELKADIENEDIVKEAISTLDAQYEDYVRKGGQETKTEWKDNTGKQYADKIKLAKDEAYKKLYDKGEAFRVKVDMHNKRFSTSYNNTSSWEKINETRKKRGAALEKIRASKPKS